MREFLDVAIEAAREAGAILLSEFDRPPTITYKGEVDLVTQADRRSEDCVVTRLRANFPKHAIVGEESGGHAPQAESKGEQPPRFCWYVDPLDGTTNFAHGYPCWAVSIALVENDEPIVGVVFNPIAREMFTAVRGEGAWLDQKPIHVSKIDRLAISLLGTGFPTHKRVQNPNIHYYWRFTLSSHGVRRDGSAALDMCSVACGRFDGFWEFGLKPWDTAAGTLIVREAGGRVTNFAGRPYQPGERECLASNGLIHEEMRALALDIAERSPAQSGS